MASPRNQPPPPLRTFSTDSTVQSSLSPTSTLASTSTLSTPTSLGISTSTPTTNPTPTSRTFFGALVQRARSRSRSRTRTRSRSPLPQAKSAATSSQNPRTQHTARMPSSSSFSSGTTACSSYPQRPTEPRRLESRASTSSSEDFYYGRHGNQWLFGGFSIRETMRDVYRHAGEKRN